MKTDLYGEYDSLPFVLLLFNRSHAHNPGLLFDFSTNTNDYHPAWDMALDEHGTHMFFFNTIEECKEFYKKSGVLHDHIMSVNVCDSNCCSYMEEHDIKNAHHCQEDCSAADAATTTSSSTAATTTTAVTTTDQTVPDSDVIECEKASRYYHPPVDMSRPYW